VCGGVDKDVEGAVQEVVVSSITVAICRVSLSWQEPLSGISQRK
jgi:hypothetical protein